MSQGKVVIITGGGQGIGKAVAGEFLRSGAKVIIAEADEEAGRETEQEYSKEGDILFVPTDVSDEGSVQEMVRQGVGRFGVIDVLVNNAGLSRNGPLESLSLEDWNYVIGVNLTGQFLCAKHTAPYLRQRNGCIINIASTRALMSEADTEAYSASKGGVLALTHALSVSLGPDIRVNCISPGWIDVSAWKKRSERKQAELSAADHSQHPAGRVGKPEDIARTVRFLTAEENSFITGANFVVDGGMTRKMIYVE